jgi:hypothetical protein
MGPVGLVLGSEDATPLTFQVAVAPGRWLQLDDVVVTDRRLPDHPGGARGVRAAVPGPRCTGPSGRTARSPSSSTACSTASRRPRPGRRAALREPRVPRRHAAAPTSTSRASRAWPPRPPTPPSCSTASSPRACWVAEALNTKALIFNVKGEDLLFLDRPTQARRDQRQPGTPKLGLPAGAFPRELSGPAPQGLAGACPTSRPAPRTCVTSFFWTLARVLQRGLLPFLFADAEDDRQQYTMVVHNVMAQLREAAPSTTVPCASTADPCAPSASWSTRHDRLRTTTTPGRGPAGHRPGHRQRVRAAALQARSARGAPDPRRRPGRPPPHPRQPGHGGRHPQPQRPRQALRGRRHHAQGVRGQGAARPGPPAAVPRARRAQQVRPARGPRARSRRSCSTSPSAAARSASS